MRLGAGARKERELHTRNDRTWKHRIANLVMAMVSLLMVASAPAAELLVSSEATDQVLRYDGMTGAFLGAFVTAGSGGLKFPQGLAFGPDGTLYVSSPGSDQVLRYDGTTGAFLNVFVAAGSGGLDFPTFLTFRPSASECPEDADAVLTRAVDPEGNDAALIGDLPTHVTLQEAVNQAQDGEVIGVYGRSTENVVISGTKSLTITQCTVAQLTAAAPGPVVHITGTGTITIISLDTVGGTIGWRVDTDGHDLKSVRASGASQVGILVVGDHNRISYNSVRGNAVGIRVEGRFNDLRGGTVEGHAGAGVQLTTAPAPTPSGPRPCSATAATASKSRAPSNTVRHNGRVNQNTLNGILVTGDRSTLMGNRSETGKGNGRHGIEVVTGADTNQLTSNQMQSNAFDGVHVFGTGNQVKSNSANVNVGAEFSISPGNMDQGGNKANGRACTFGAAGGTCN